MKFAIRFAIAVTALAATDAALIPVSASAAFDNAPAAVESDVRDLANIVMISNASTRLNHLCSLIESRVQLEAIANQWLGSFAYDKNDLAGIAKFKSLTSSILAAQFQKLLEGNSQPQYVVATKATGRGRNKVSVKVNWNDKNLEVFLDSMQFKILDVSMSNISLVSHLGDDFQTRLNAYWRANPQHATPAASLAQELINGGGLPHCY
jgi:ABC-type transporter MlaC component